MACYDWTEATKGFFLKRKIQPSFLTANIKMLIYRKMFATSILRSGEILQEFLLLHFTPFRGETCKISIVPRRNFPNYRVHFAKNYLKRQLIRADLFQETSPTLVAFSKDELKMQN